MQLVLSALLGRPCLGTHVLLCLAAPHGRWVALHMKLAVILPVVQRAAEYNLERLLEDTGRVARRKGCLQETHSLVVGCTEVPVCNWGSTPPMVAARSCQWHLHT